jgi:hypothetical protein
MQYLLPTAMFHLMISVGMRLRPTEAVANWRKLDWFRWWCLVTATFIIPTALFSASLRDFPSCAEIEPDLRLVQKLGPSPLAHSCRFKNREGR